MFAYTLNTRTPLQLCDHIFPKILIQFYIYVFYLVFLLPQLWFIFLNIRLILRVMHQSWAIGTADVCWQKRFQIYYTISFLIHLTLTHSLIDEIFNSVGKTTGRDPVYSRKENLWEILKKDCIHTRQNCWLSLLCHA